MKRVIWLALIAGVAISKPLSAQVGIGTDTPEHTLHVKPATGNEDPIKIEGLQYAFAGDTALLVVNPADGIVRMVTIQALLKNLNTSLDDQKAIEVPLYPHLDVDNNDVYETDVQEALEVIADKFPKGTYRSIREARTAGLLDGDSFYAHPQGVFGCSGCIITLYPEMK